MTAARNPIFWRDARMPHIELHKVADGRKVCYDLHSHNHWSLGAITQGISIFINRDDSYHVRQGDLVLMNPDWRMLATLSKISLGLISCSMSIRLG